MTIHEGGAHIPALRHTLSYRRAIANILKERRMFAARSDPHHISARILPPKPRAPRICAPVHKDFQAALSRLVPDCRFLSRQAYDESRGKNIDRPGAGSGRWRAWFAVHPVASLLFTRAGRICAANPAAGSLFRCHAAALAGNFLTEFFPELGNSWSEASAASVHRRCRGAATGSQHVHRARAVVLLGAVRATPRRGSPPSRI